MTEFDPHPVLWTPEKVSRYWDFVGSHQLEPFFSSVYGRSIIDVVAGLRPRQFVDIGCGTGDLIVEAAQRGIIATGVDTSEELLNLARRRTETISPRPSFLIGDGITVPIATGTVDAATIIEVVEHLDDDHLEATLSEARRILRPDGSLIVTTPNAEDLGSRTVQCPDCGGEFHTIQHVRSWTAKTLAERLSMHGFVPRVRVTRLVENGPWHERLARGLYYRLARLSPHLVSVSRVA